MATSQNREGLELPRLGCDFCDEFSGGASNAFGRLYADTIRDRTLLATREFRIIPSLGQIVEGYLLVVATKHYQALADMPPELGEELVELNGRVRGALSDAYGPCIFFEHGARSENSGGCGIYHAHLHAVPLREGRDPIALLKERFSLKKLRSIREIAGEANGADSYLYYEDLHSNRYIFDVEYLPSQYMRRLLAEATGNDEWDWRECGWEEAVVSTIARLAKAFSTSEANAQPRLVGTAG
jgi:diadenosine tetraphosphate (Ap4A) HIT family hydrolase